VTQRREATPKQLAHSRGAAWHPVREPEVIQRLKLFCFQHNLQPFAPLQWVSLDACLSHFGLMTKLLIRLINRITPEMVASLETPFRPTPIFIDFEPRRA
jgi:hypothetical protein